MPTAGDGLVDHGLLETKGALGVGLVLDLLKNVCAESVDVLFAVSCKALDEAGQVHVVSETVRKIRRHIAFELVSDKV